MTYEQYHQARSFPGLDGLRGVAATVVVIFHFGGSQVRLVQGWVGVQVFFALSGFLITTLALREVDRTGRLDLRAFYLRRFFRIAPAYYVVLGLVLLQCATTRTGWRELRAALPFYLTFLNDVGPTSAAYIHTWTLGVEQKFYLAWPLLAFVLARGVRGRLAVAVATGTVFACLIDIRRLHSGSFVVLALGSLLAVAMHHPRGFALVRPLLSRAGSGCVAVGFLAFHLAFTPLLDRFGEQRMIPFYGAAVCMLLPAVIGPGPVRWVLSRPAVVFVGQRSYSLYLVQFVAGAVAVAVLPGFTGRSSLWTALVTWLTGVLLADLLHRWVEQPMIRVGRAVSRRRVGERPGSAATS